MQSPSSLLHQQHNSAIVNKLLEKGPVPGVERDFLINGWRWHARAVLRDVGRFRAVVLQEKKQMTEGQEGGMSNR
jgi:hypothetical protein